MELSRHNRRLWRMITARMHLSILILATCASLGCGRAEHAWEEAQVLDTIEAYENFVLKYPQNSHASEAAKRIEQMRLCDRVRDIADMRMLEIFHYVPDPLMANKRINRLGLLEPAGAHDLSRAIAIYRYRGHAVRLWGERDWPSGGIEARALTPDEADVSGGPAEAKLVIGEWDENSFKNERVVLKVYYDHTPRKENAPQVVFIRKSPETLQQDGDDVGFDFGDRWSPLFAVQGDSLPDMEFRTGGVRLRRGEVVFLEGTQVRIETNPSEIFSFENGRWRLTDVIE